MKEGRLWWRSRGDWRRRPKRDDFVTVASKVTTSHRSNLDVGTLARALPAQEGPSRAGEAEHDVVMRRFALGSTLAGVLLATRDGGHTWEAPVIGGKVVALSVGRPPLAIVEAAEGTMLMRIDRGEGVQPRNAESLLGTQSRLAVASTFIVAARPAAGVGVSSDGGATFHRLRGGSGVSAVTVGMVEGRPTAFIACFKAADCESTLLLVEPLSVSPVKIANIRMPLPDEEMPEDEARITTLVWDTTTSTLWAGGGFGVARFRRPET